MKIRPTLFGFKAAGFYLALLGAFLAIPYANLFFLLLAFLTVMALLGPWWTVRNLTGLESQILPIEPCPGGTGPLVRIELDPLRRTRLGLCWELQLDGRRIAVAMTPLARQAQTLAARLEPLPRGVHRVHQALVSTTHPFGFLRAERNIAAPEEIVVYPAPAEIEDPQRAGALLASLGLGCSGPGNSAPAGLHEYRPGDDPRLIHWKASARGHGLVVKELESDLLRGLEIVLDRRASEETLERALGQIVSLARLAEERKEPLTLTTQDHRETYGAGHRPFPELLRCLAQVSALPPAASAPHARSPHVLLLPLAEGA